MSASTSISRDLLPGDLLDGDFVTDDGPSRRDIPLPVGLCAAALITGSLGCWVVILYVASLI